MAHFREEYEASGHTVVIQKVNERVPFSTWINGKAGYEDTALDNLNQIESKEIREKIQNHLSEGERLDAIKTLMSYMTDNDLYFCSKCERFYDQENVQSGGFAGHTCTKCQREKDHCPETRDNEHEIECQNPSQKRNARVPTRYKCTECGYTRHTTPTG